ncbi:MAG: family 16 glycoside hydrolase [Rubripirellula sp.]
MQTTQRAIAILSMLLGLSTTAALAQVYDRLETANDDPDFKLQGEYADSTRGLHIIARGEGGFEVVIYPGGLPGAGWTGKDKQRLELESEQVESMVKQFDRVERKSPTLGAKPPVGAVVLFDGTPGSIEKHWRPGAKMTDDGLLQEGCTSIDTFGDYTLHLEFRLPFMPKATGQGRANSGVYHQGRYETQVLDSFGLEGKNNETGGLYQVRDPDLNMCLPPLVWQTYDVDLTSARFDEAGKKIANARITVKLNGVVVQRDVELPGPTPGGQLAESAANGPIHLQQHGNPVRYRNIWVRPRNIDAEARRPIVPGFERFHGLGEDSLAGGRLLFGELNCVACHETPSDLASSAAPKQAPILDQVGQRVHPEWMVKYLTDPHAAKPGTTMPDVMSGMSPQERREAALALTNFLVGTDTIKSGTKSGNAGVGERLFHEAGCVACHLSRDGRKVSAATSVPLIDLGEKYSRASLEEFLKNPLAVRASGRMPQLDLGGDNWRHVAQYLTGDASVTFGTARDLPKEPNLKFSAYFVGVDKFPNMDELEPDLTGVSRGLDIGVGKRNENVLISYSGFLPIKTAGKYSFQLASDDGSRLFIDDKLVIDNDGVHPRTSKEATISLGAGAHAIRVDWFEKGGEEELSLVWAGPGIKSGHIDKSLVMSRDGVDVPVQVEAPPVDPEEFVYDESKVEAGRRLFTSLGCVGCHTKTDQGKRMAATSKPPKLADCDSTKGCLAESGQDSVPNYDLTEIQRLALATVVNRATDRFAPTPDVQANHTMKSLNCYACHRRDGVGGVELDRNTFFVSSIPEMGDEGRLPPPLDGVGDKLRADWTRQVIGRGNKSRPYMLAHMPQFGDANGGQLAEVFEQLDKRTEANPESTDESELRQVAAGRLLVGAKGLGCVSCHTYGKFKSTGIQALALDTMSKRLREDWFHRYMLDPQAYRPGTRMPTGFPDGKSTVPHIYGGNPAEQTSAMWAFLEKGTSGGVPDGIVGGMIELKPDSDPVIYRNFIEGVSPRGIAVGYPEKANLCWDAQEMSLTLIWQNRFIDASKHWVGRGQGRQTPLGGSLLTFEKTSPVALLADEAAAWPQQSAAERGLKFLGYRLDEKGRPTFRYRAPFANVEDKPIPVPSEFDGTFKRELTITPVESESASGTIYFRAASGSIVQQPDGDYLVDGRVRIGIETSGAAPLLRNDAAELLVPVDGPTKITQRIVW